MHAAVTHLQTKPFYVDKKLILIYRNKLFSWQWSDISLFSQHRLLQTPPVVTTQITIAYFARILTETVIEEAFRKRTRSKDSIRSIEMTRAAPAGEGLISAVYRIKVTGILHSASFVGKGFVSDALLTKTVRSDIYYKREVQFLFFSHKFCQHWSTYKSPRVLSNPSATTSRLATPIFAMVIATTFLWKTWLRATTHPFPKNQKEMKLMPY